MIGMKMCSIMADRDGEQGQPHDGGTMFDDRQKIQRRCRQHTAAGAGAAAQSSLAPRASGAKPCAWMSGFRAKFFPDSGLIWVAAAKDGGISGKKRRLRGKTAALSGVQRAKSPYFAHSKDDLGGICRENSR